MRKCKCFLFLVISALFINPKSMYVFAGDLGFGTTIATSYCKWSKIFGIPDVSEETSFSDPDENNMITLQIDDIAILYNASTLEAGQVIFFFMNESKDASHQLLKMNALVAALEYDEYLPPEEWNYCNAGTALGKTLPAFQNLCTVIEDQREKILSGEYICFHTGEKCDYVIGYDLECGYVIVAQ